MGLYVPLFVNYAEDPKVIDAGPMGELLYVRSLAFAKRQEKDGLIHDNQFREYTGRIPRARVVAERLYEVGLWERNGTGLYISAWLKRNAPVAEVASAKSAAGSLGNHRKWHTGSGKKPNPDCKHCVDEGLT